MVHVGYALSNDRCLSILDESSGCYDLAAVEESFVIAFSKSGNNDPNRLNVALNRAYRVSDFYKVMLHWSFIVFHLFSNS